MLTLTRQEAKSVSLLTQDERLAKIKETLSAERWVDHGRWEDQRDAEGRTLGRAKQQEERSTVHRSPKGESSCKFQGASCKN
ncbi:hypothetical protein V511_14005 [Mesotoga sp. Brook.08.YT.4.2.5.1]|nr:hypothetical protein V511_14005 [Mesotoga sp. Brook.08.YT.4.2.5.1]